MSCMVARFERNRLGCDFVVGDIHGFFSRLQAHLDAIAFDPARDRLFSVGDLVDRGPECDQALDWLAQPWFHAVRGNHEDMAIRWPNGNMDKQNYVANGGGWNVANPRAESQRIADALSALPIAIELETEHGKVGIVHAECPTEDWQTFVSVLEGPRVSKRQRDAAIDCAMWSRNRIDGMFCDETAGVIAVIVGHTPVERFTSLGNTLYIDTGGWLRGRDFTILDTRTLRPVDSRRLQW